MQAAFCIFFKKLGRGREERRRERGDERKETEEEEGRRGRERRKRRGEKKRGEGSPLCALNKSCVILPNLQNHALPKTFHGPPMALKVFQKILESPL